ncbi:hypothetical protein B0H10DRAFT_1957030 [Mycena sp. CBHHK59/15]|nr:hypothetical protein B0H10DRAFT_1957030 [Mycena sp. CBHHK59/15]
MKFSFREPCNFGAADTQIFWTSCRHMGMETARHLFAQFLLEALHVLHREFSRELALGCTILRLRQTLLGFRRPRTSFQNGLLDFPVHASSICKFSCIISRSLWVYGTSQYSINRKSSSGADDLIYSADQLSAKIDLIHQTFDEYLVTLYKAKQGRKLHQNHRKLARSQTKCEFSQGRRFGKLMGNPASHGNPCDQRNLSKV